MHHFQATLIYVIHTLIIFNIFLDLGNNFWVIFEKGVNAIYRSLKNLCKKNMLVHSVLISSNHDISLRPSHQSIVHSSVCSTQALQF